LEAPQIQHRNVLSEILVEGIGALQLFNLPAKFEKTPCEVISPPPRLSADTDEVLGQLGYTEEEINAMREAGDI